MTWNGLYEFDGETLELSLLPMAARRALDVAGVHLSLESFRKLSLDARARLVALGAADTVVVSDVRACLQPLAAELRGEPCMTEPSLSDVPATVSAGLGAACPTGAEWAALHALDRYVLVKLAARGKLDRLERAMLEIRGQGR
jgi:hypothetical protein